MLQTLFNMLLIVVGFGLVIFIHELGHFAAARWAGIRVHAFAIGFGGAICSWRRGIGFRRGSSEKEYLRLAGAPTVAHAPTRVDGPTGPVSPTEYRLNIFPLGGYVKMLGQEDANPQAASRAPDSFTSAPIYKRMVVICAGVVMNVLLAGVLFMIVFLAGMREVAPVVGVVADDSPAQQAGLRSGDLVVSIDGKPAETFRDIFIAAAMGREGVASTVTVRRPGVDEPITVEMTAIDSNSDAVREFGIYPGASNVLASDEGLSAFDRQRFASQLRRAGLDRAGPGAVMLEAGGKAVPSVRAWQGAEVALSRVLADAAAESDGKPIPVRFRTESGEDVQFSITPRATLQHALQSVAFEHLAGFVPPMEVVDIERRAQSQGLRVGDVFARVGASEWPSPPRAVEIIRDHAGSSVEVEVLRDGAHVPLTLHVGRDGRVGFTLGTASHLPIVTSFPDELAEADPPAAVRMDQPVLPGSRFESVAGTPVASYADVRAAIVNATRFSAENGSGAEIPVTFRVFAESLPPEGAIETMTLALTPDEVGAIHALGWNADLALAQFAPASFVMKAESPVGAMLMGVRHTKRYIAMTYLTFRRLITGDVAVSSISGPVGIVHIGATFASQGMVYLLFFLGLLSANLAVINFLPVPIVDGGLFVMLCIEGITRRPVPMKIQELATLAGLLLIATVFVVVTYNDIVRLFT